MAKQGKTSKHLLNIADLMIFVKKQKKLKITYVANMMKLYCCDCFAKLVYDEFKDIMIDV